MAKRRIYDSNSEESVQSFSTIEPSDIDLAESLMAGSEEEPEYAGSSSSEQESADALQLHSGAPEHFTFGSSQLSEAVKHELRSKLADFLNSKYVRDIKAMCTANSESLYIEYSDLSMFHSVLDSSPESFLELLSEALSKVVHLYFSNYSTIRPQVHARLVGLPVTESLRDLRNSHLGKLVRVHGIVTRRSGIFSQYSIVRFTCTKCRATFGPFVGKDLKPSACFECQSRGPFVVNSSETVYKDFQRVTLQEVPGSVTSGSLPRSKDLLLYHDLIDACRPGDEVDVTGIYKNNYSVSLNLKNGFPVFSTVIEASSITRKEDEKGAVCHESDVKAMRAMARNPNIVEVLVDSVAPSIFGHRTTKLAMLLAMVNGEAKEKNGMHIRGDINVLLMGDPGTAKSQFLRYVHRMSPRAVLATGQGSSSVGLTASVKRDPALGEWTLEGGALVLADRGVCCIDEFDKMNETDRVSIHEAMEQQSISISKAGIIASLHARCAVIAAANPTRGCYNPVLSFSQNVNLSDPILSRFDLLCVIKDVIDEGEDASMARFILRAGCSEGNSTAPQHSETVSQEVLRKYIAYAKASVHPAISQIDVRKISQLYSELRKESISSGIPITVRHIESIIRISEAFAKLRLSESVEKRDIDAAISITLSSFLAAQKQSVQKQLKKKFSRYFDENTDDVALYILKRMIGERLGSVGNSDVTRKEFLARCLNSGVKVADRFFSSEQFLKEGFRVESDVIARNINLGSPSS